jgi:tetratricopeptide (TPR) repeat protein
MGAVIMKLFLLVIVCFGSPYGGFSSANYTDSATVYLQQALQFKQLRKLADAESHFKKALQLNPTDVSARIEYGTFLADERKYFFAAEQFQKVLQATSDNIAALQKMTEISFLLHRWKDALTYGNKLKGANRDRKISFILGSAYYEEEDYGQSEKLLTEAIKEDPKYREALTLLGKVYIELSNYKQAVICYNQALELDPANSNLLYEAGLLQFTLDNEEAAVKYFEQAAEKGYKTDLNYTENLGMAYLGFDIKKGIEILNKVLEKKPNDAEIIWQIAEAYYKAKQYQLAADLYNKLFEKDPSDSKALYMTGMAYQRKGDKNQGVFLCEKAIRMDPTLAELKRLMFAK